MIAAIVQARMGSTRSPGKVLRTAAGKTLLEHLVERLGFAKSLDRTVVATSTLPADTAIADLCARLGVRCVRGSERDVLDRYYQAACEIGATTVVRITADCPLVDPVLVDRMVEIQQREAAQWDLVTNRYPLTFPDGLDVDIMPLDALRSAWERAVTQPQREHVIPYFWEAGLRVKNVAHPENLFKRHRWTVDYEEDVQLVRRIFEMLYRPGAAFSMEDVLALLSRQPELQSLNARYLPGAGTA